jgi:hypothetical protein
MVTTRKPDREHLAGRLADFFREAEKLLRAEASKPPRKEVSDLRDLIDQVWKLTTRREVTTSVAMTLVSTIEFAAEHLWLARANEPSTRGPTDAEKDAAVVAGLRVFGRHWPGYAKGIARDKFASAVVAWDAAADKDTGARWFAVNALLDNSGLGYKTKTTAKDYYVRWCADRDRNPSGQLPWWPSSMKATMAMFGRATAEREPTRQRRRSKK